MLGTQTPRPLAPCRVKQYSQEKVFHGYPRKMNGYYVKNFSLGIMFHPGCTVRQQALVVPGKSSELGGKLVAREILPEV